MYRQGLMLAQRYRLDVRVGGGGMGEVWRGTDVELERTVAVKTVRAELLDEPGFRERFRAEARTMAKIRHPGVVAVHDYFSDDSGAFLVMEYIEGEALSQTLRRLGRLDATRAMLLIADAADALQAAHDRGVVHRDIKPANLMLAGGSKLVLTDFGIARSAANTSLTATGALIGTASYLAPEQVLGRPASARSDVYALGVVAYECLSGRRPFDGDNPFDVALRRLREPPPPLGVEVPPPVLAVVEKALAAEPEQRWQTATELAVAARRAVGASPRPPTSPAASPGSPAGAGPRHSAPSPVSGGGTGLRPAPGTGGGGPGTPPGPQVPPPRAPYTPAPYSPPPYRPTPTPTPNPGGYRPPGPTPPPPGYPATGFQPTGFPGAPGYQRQRAPNNTPGLLAMIFGILSIVLVCCYIGLALGLAAVVLGAIGMKKASEGEATNRGQALAGVICGGVGLVLSVVVIGFGLASSFWP